MDGILRLYDGIPAHVNAFDVFAIGAGEDAHTEVLAWLLDPAETHGLGDVVLRRFLLLSRTPEAVEAALCDGPLVAIVRTQFELPGYGVPDLVIAIDGVSPVVVVVEAKVDAGLTLDGDGVPQTLRYRQAVADHAFHRALGLKPGDRVAFALVFLHAQREQDPNDDARGEEPLGVASFQPLLYREVERSLAEVVGAEDFDPRAAVLISSFRSSILANASGTDDPLGALRRLRLARLRRESTRWSGTSAVLGLARDVEVLSGRMVGTMAELAPELKQLVLANAATVDELGQILTEARRELLSRVTKAVEECEASRTFDGKRFDYEVAGGRGKRWGLARPDAKTAVAGVQVTLDTWDGGIGFTIETSVYSSAVGGMSARKALLGDLQLPASATDKRGEANGLWTRTVRDSSVEAAASRAAEVAIEEYVTARKVYEALAPRPNQG